ncbi:hypothetical protein AVEN_249894-1 [Araneus ventricosus]|uniref:Uncharacterized protein n=1 Tax=Araneus ventricosus TaxID=182803 RepID=A0A4Y2GZT4_ARAVE|nr:hypothetical protein AVEN_178956-1 [Araneus ventricosus]GBM84757.1 hypothetical protein AVEN_249894-1 [Araneus ventricosus]
MDLVILNRGQMTTKLAPPYPSFHVTPAGGRLAPAYDLACSTPNIQRIISGIGFRTWNPRGSKADTLPLPHNIVYYLKHQMQKYFGTGIRRAE